MINFNDINVIIFAVFSLAFAIQLVYLWGIFARLSFFKPKIDKHIEKPVSVVITSRDDYYNLKRFLPQILTQDYPEYEVILVNEVIGNCSF